MARLAENQRYQGRIKGTRYDCHLVQVTGMEIDAGDAAEQTPFSGCWGGRRVDRNLVAEWRCGGMGVSCRV
jgi:hypothetical protein